VWAFSELVCTMIAIFARISLDHVKTQLLSELFLTICFRTFLLVLIFFSSFQIKSERDGPSLSFNLLLFFFFFLINHKDVLLKA
jgi:hypothetical protein